VGLFWKKVTFSAGRGGGVAMGASPYSFERGVLLPGKTIEPGEKGEKKSIYEEKHVEP